MQQSALRFPAMRSVFINFISLHAENVSAEVWIGLAAIYVVMVGITLTSVWSNTWSKRASLIWTTIVVALPIVGIFVYSLASLSRCDFSFLKQFRLGASSEIRQSDR